MSLRWLALVTAFGLISPHVLADEEDESSCEPTTLDDLPNPVKDALQSHTQGKKVEEICKKTEDGDTRYEAEVISGNAGTVLEFDEDGNVLKQHSHSESGEHGHQEQQGRSPTMGE